MSSQFPQHFMWGTATASFQIEGSSHTRSPSIWDHFCSIPGKVINNDTGDVACDHYNRYEKDVSLIKSLNTSYYRFSISWPRIFTYTSENIQSPSPNSEGIAFYNSLIDQLLDSNITPVVTLYHWDLPLVIDQVLGGWNGDAQIADLFSHYAKTCFELFGDRVKWWITLNEPWCSSLLGYEIGEHAPGKGKKGIDLYRAAHNLLRSHAKAVEVYRKQYQTQQNGKIGITLNSNWAEPKDENDEACVKAAQRAVLFELGWFADPIYFGDYPQCMKDSVGERLPQFTNEEKDLLKGSSDFFGLNHYSTQYITGMMKESSVNKEQVSYSQDMRTESWYDPSWKKTDMGWAIVPWGFSKLLKFIQDRYKPTGGIIVTENGLAANEKNLEMMKEDRLRLEFFHGYIGEMLKAIENGADVRGYFLWSLLDNFEWAFGYEKRFGLFYVDYKTQERYMKPVAKWYSKVVKNNRLISIDDYENEDDI